MKDSDFFTAQVMIRNTDTGETRVYQSDHESRDEEGEFRDFIWADGNYACDCNRALFFARAAGEDDPDRECGDTLFEIVSITEVATGKVLYSETD